MEAHARDVDTILAKRTRSILEAPLDLEHTGLFVGNGSDGGASAACTTLGSHAP
jgi:hypothetical protein